MSSLMQKKPINGYLLAFGIPAIAALCIFMPFAILDGGLFKLAGDFNSQQITFYAYANEFFKNWTGDWSWQTDLGGSMINSYSFYLLGSPFFWLTTILPSSWVPFVMAPMFAVKFGVAGHGAYLYAKRYLKSNRLAVVAACLYALSGFTIYNTFFNHFVDVIALFPFMLWALDEFIYEGRRGLFALTVAINLINNYFFFAGQVVFLLIYFFFMFFTREYKLKWRHFGVLAFEAILGCAMGCLLLIPAMLSLANNPRTINLSNGYDLLMYGRVQQYFAILSSLFLPPDPTYLPNIFPDAVIKHTSMTAYLPLMSCVGVLAYLRINKKSAFSKIMITCLICALVPVLNSAFYALNSSYYARWYYMPILIMCVASAKALENCTSHELYDALKPVAGITAAFMAFALVPTKKDDVWKIGNVAEQAQFWLTIGTAALGLLLFYMAIRYFKDEQGRHKFTSVLLAMIFGFSCFYGITYVALTKFPQWNGDANYKQECYDGARNADLPEGFYRIDSDGTFDNVGMWAGRSSLQFFNSTVSPSIMEFYPNLGIKRDVSSHPEQKIFAVRGLLSVQYLLTPVAKAEAFTTENAQYGWVADHADDTFTYFLNTNYIPMGFAYDSCISLNDFLTVAETDRAALLVRAIALDEEQMATYGSLYTSQLSSTANEPFSYENYQLDAAARKAQSASTFEPDGSGFTSSITLERDTLVFFSVPYDEGFTATVNGVETPVEKVSGGMSAVKGNAGENEIVFTYKTPGQALSQAMSFGGIFIWIAYCGFLIVRKKRKVGIIKKDGELTL